ncbi:hypothetical protein [Streptomyces sp. SGAir0957]
MIGEQLRHLAGLVREEPATGSTLTIRILPFSSALYVTTRGEFAEVTLHGHRMVAIRSLSPVYESGSGIARAIHAGLQDALAAAWGRDETLSRLDDAAAAMERRAPA